MQEILTESTFQGTAPSSWVNHDLMSGDLAWPAFHKKLHPAC